MFLIDPIDEVAMTNLQQFKEKTLVDISKEDLDLGEEGEEEQAKVGRMQVEFGRTHKLVKATVFLTLEPMK